MAAISPHAVRKTAEHTQPALLIGPGRSGGTRRTVAGPVSSSTEYIRDLIIRGTAHRGANGAAMLTDEDDHDDNFPFSHPERGGNFAAA